ncbi:hypothetical protein CVT25_009933 [Psilocybe cyanescens]|uniref:Uncharacterized protein n=1 Tax=Psilocybe cyanescens TaxID=93625 RepID=A0A409XCP8_PSICY|nr:hypothetical protein CVT25_009933 [Psilocybe cyanescens]
MPVPPQPPDPSGSAPSWEGALYSENNTPKPIECSLIDTVLSAGEIIALIKSISKTTSRIVDDLAAVGDNPADIQTGFDSLSQRLQHLQTLIYRRISCESIAKVSNLYDLLENYHCSISTIRSHMHSGFMSMELLDEYTKNFDDFQSKFEMSVPVVTNTGRGGDMFPNCQNIAISGGQFVSAGVVYMNTQASTTMIDKLVKLVYVQIGILFGIAGRV